MSLFGLQQNRTYVYTAVTAGCVSKPELSFNSLAGYCSRARLGSRELSADLPLPSTSPLGSIAAAPVVQAGPKPAPNFVSLTLTKVQKQCKEQQRGNRNSENDKNQYSPEQGQS